MHQVFTTGQVAKVFSVNINTVIKWFDEGKLNGFRLPRSNERRIYRESVIGFMNEHGISPELLTAFDRRIDKKKRGRKGATEETPVVSETAGNEAARRAFPRTPVDLVAQMRPLGGETIAHKVSVKNLSMGGALISGLDPEFTEIPIEFELLVQHPEDGPNLDGRCQVVHLRRDKERCLELGVRFTQVDPGSLKTYLSAIGH